MSENNENDHWMVCHMSLQVLDGIVYNRMLLGGTAVLTANMETLNAMNVFPVADGDTGTNMSQTMQGGMAGIADKQLASIGELTGAFARGVLLSAKGNSGVILSQIFAGITEGLRGCDSVCAVQLAEAYRKGIEKSYASVQNPTEGTILTVFRESTEFAAERINENSTIEEFFELHIAQARRSLAATKERLAVLADADVVDSGGAGYLYVAEGMYGVLTGKTDLESIKLPEKTSAPSVDIDRFTRDSILEFGYCTEVLIRLTTAKVDPDAFDIKTILADLEELHGESIVAYKQDDIVKVHVHTFEPGVVMARLQRYGEFLTVKVENMSLGHTEVKKKSSRAFSVVAVSSGEGLSQLFTKMGAHYIVSGGQTANPSIQDFLNAFAECDSPHIIVLPNNKNVILAAQQAAQIYTQSQVHVLETKNLMQGYGALSVINPGVTDMEALLNSARRAAENVSGGEITQAIRDVTIDGVAVKQGDYIAISDGGIAAAEQTPEDAVEKMMENLDMDLAEIITLFAGENADPDSCSALAEKLEEAYPDCEIVVQQGGQPVYTYLVAVE